MGVLSAVMQLQFFIQALCVIVVSCRCDLPLPLVKVSCLGKKIFVILDITLCSLLVGYVILYEPASLSSG
jgi:hypothetical protein